MNEGIRIMWAKVEITHSDEDLIYLPLSLTGEYREHIQIKFGGLNVRVKVRYADGAGLEGSTYDRPGALILSDHLVEKLMIPRAPVYQIKIREGNLRIGPVIGFLLGSQTQRYSPEHMEKYSDRFGIYHKVGGLIYAFSPRSIEWKKNAAFGLYYNIEKSKWEYGKFPLPETIYRRDFHSDPEVIEKLIRYTHGRLFNSYRFDKYELYRFVGQNEELKKYLPPTEIIESAGQVSDFIGRFPCSIIKPVDLSRGRGILVVETNEGGYKITDYRQKDPVVEHLDGDSMLNAFFERNTELFSQHIIQKYLPLASIGSSIFDVRVVMQKRVNHSWGCSGIECRVSNDDCLLTNISKGGYALTLKHALHKSFPDNGRQIPKKNS
ncbi:MAG TPA: YheC/YheD family protein [Clostridia bacterium]|nr:YheC/YheD family protein [Clostridia bacterium]